MKSMTGFSQSQFSDGNLKIDISMKAVNGRYLDLRMHLPWEYNAFEQELKRKLSENLRRGSIDVYVSRRLIKKTEVKVEFHPGLAKEWIKAYKKLSDLAGIKSEITLDSLVKIPQLFEVQANQKISKNESDTMIKAVLECANLLNLERFREGDALKKDILKHCKELSKVVKTIEKNREIANKELRIKMKSRWDQMELSSKIDPNRLAQEAAILLDKSDISEEIQRLNEHISAFCDEVRSVNCEGKKLDFFTQELLREVNTIGSKSQVSILSQLVVEGKTRIEKIREQVQNVE